MRAGKRFVVPPILTIGTDKFTAVVPDFVEIMPSLPFQENDNPTAPLLVAPILAP